MRIENIKNILADEGLRPKIDDDGDLFFKYEGNSFFLDIDDDDPCFLRIILPNFWEFTDEIRDTVGKACLEATAQAKVAKIFPVENNIWSSAELFIADEKTLTPIIFRLLDSVVAAATVFIDIMEENQAD